MIKSEIKKDLGQVSNKRIIFGLGSNLGDREFNLNQASKMLKSELALTNIKKSTIFKNPALLLPNSPKEWDIEFFNIALSADINIEDFPPQKILEIIKNIEKSMGRKYGQKWSPREIDIDILTIEDLILNIGDKLIIPHYDLLNRDFFLQTIKEIEPNWKYPSALQVPTI